MLRRRVKRARDGESAADGEGNSERSRGSARLTRKEDAAYRGGQGDENIHPVSVLVARGGVQRREQYVRRVDVVRNGGLFLLVAPKAPARADFGNFGKTIKLG